VEKEYAEKRKPLGIHHGFVIPGDKWADAVRCGIGEPSICIDPPQPLLTINHTALPDGEAIHLVNRQVNLFTRISLKPRADLKLRIHPQKPVRRVWWLCPARDPLALDFAKEENVILLSLPVLHAYGIVRLEYERIES
jgi:hypothetical protein